MTGPGGEDTTPLAWALKTAPVRAYARDWRGLGARGLQTQYCEACWGPKSWSWTIKVISRTPALRINPVTILQSDLLGFATPVTKMEILVTGPRH